MSPAWSRRECRAVWRSRSRPPARAGKESRTSAACRSWSAWRAPLREGEWRVANGESMIAANLCHYSLLPIRHSLLAIRLSPLHQRAVIEAAVEPILIAGDVLLHRDVDEGLV